MCSRWIHGSGELLLAVAGRKATNTARGLAWTTCLSLALMTGVVTAQSDPTQEARLLWAAGNQVGATHWASYVGDREGTLKGLRNIVELYKSTACLDPKPWQALLDELQAGASPRALFPRIVALEDAFMAASGISGYSCLCQSRSRPPSCDLSGNWVFYRPEEPRHTFPARITQTGTSVILETLEDRHQLRSDGCSRLLDPNREAAPEIRDNGQRIIWPNGSVFVRAQHGMDLIGSWRETGSGSSQPGRAHSIATAGPKLLADQSSNLFLANGGTTLWAPEWNLTAAITDGGRRINWSNGSVWVR